MRGDVRRFDPLTLESNVKCVSCALHIAAIELFAIFVSTWSSSRSPATTTTTSNNDDGESVKMLTYFVDTLTVSTSPSPSQSPSSIVERWLRFYTLLLRMDLRDQSELLADELDAADDIEQQQQVPTKKAAKQPALKSKMLLDAWSSVVLLLSKMERVRGAHQDQQQTSTTSRVEQVLDKLRIERLMCVGDVFEALLDAVAHIVRHLASVNAMLNGRRASSSSSSSSTSTSTQTQQKGSSTSAFVRLGKSNEIFK